MNKRIRRAQVRDEYDNVWDDSWLPLRIANQVIMIHYDSLWFIMMGRLAAAVTDRQSDHHDSHNDPGGHTRAIHTMFKYELNRHVYQT